MISILLAMTTALATGEGQGNVLWVVLDDLSNEYVGVYDEGPAETQPPTPQMDRLAQRGMLFENFYVNPVCSPTRAMLLTGEHAFRSGIGTVDSRNQLPYSLTTLPEALPENHSALIGIWKIGSAEASNLEPIAHGFSWFAGKMHGPPKYSEWTRSTSWRWSSREKSFSAVYQTSQNVDDLLALVPRLPEPWFICFNMKSPHRPFHVPPEHLHTQGEPKGDAGMYRAMIEAADTEIGRLAAHLDLERTTLLILGDNGSYKSLSHPLGNGKSTTLEGGVNCPLIAVGRGVRAGVRTKALISGVDLFETTLELTGHGGSHDTQDGVSFVSVLKDPKARVREFVYGERFSIDGSVDERYARDKRYKLRYDAVERYEQFYDLSTAPPGADGPQTPIAFLNKRQTKRLDALRKIIRISGR